MELLVNYLLSRVAIACVIVIVYGTFVKVALQKASMMVAFLFYCSASHLQVIRLHFSISVTHLKAKSEFAMPKTLCVHYLPNGRM